MNKGPRQVSIRCKVGGVWATTRAYGSVMSRLFGAKSSTIYPNMLQSLRRLGQRIIRSFLFCRPVLLRWSRV